MSDFVATSVELSGSLTVTGPIAEAFELFSPLGERLWVPGWSPELLHPPSASWERGLIFRTQQEHGEAIWLVTALERERHQVEYHRVEPGHYVVRVQVRCTASGERKTLVDVTYVFVGLSEGGNQEIALMSSETFRRRMERWSGWIDEYLSGRGSCDSS